MIETAAPALRPSFPAPLPHRGEVVFITLVDESRVAGTLSLLDDATVAVARRRRGTGTVVIARSSVALVQCPNRDWPHLS